MPTSLSPDPLPRAVKITGPGGVCELLQISRAKAFELIRTGELASIKIGSARRVPVVAIEDFLSSTRRAG